MENHMFWLVSNRNVQDTTTWYIDLLIVDHPNCRRSKDYYIYSYILSIKLAGIISWINALMIPIKIGWKGADFSGFFSCQTTSSLTSYHLWAPNSARASQSRRVVAEGPQYLTLSVGVGIVWWKNVWQVMNSGWRCSISIEIRWNINEIDFRGGKWCTNCVMAGLWIHPRWGSTLYCPGRITDISLLTSRRGRSEPVNHHSSSFCTHFGRWNHVKSHLTGSIPFFAT